MNNIIRLSTNPGVKTSIGALGSISSPELIKKIEAKKLYCDPYEEMELDDATTKILHYLNDGCVTFVNYVNEYHRSVREDDAENVTLDREISRLMERELEKKLTLYEDLTGKEVCCVTMPKSDDIWSDISYALMERDGTSYRLMATDIQSAMNMFAD